MIAQVVFDLPLEGHFDYVIPSSLESRVIIGTQVEVLFGTKKRTGIVTGLVKESEFKNLKPLKSVIGSKRVLDKHQLILGQQLSNYYGCSLGEALFTIARGCEGRDISDPIASPVESSLTLYVSHTGQYDEMLISLMKNAIGKGRVLILVADQFAAKSIEEVLTRSFPPKSYVIGTRSLVFRSWLDVGHVIMIDEENSSFKQEQTPMYETREVLLMRARIEQMNISFLSTTPSVELMDLVAQGRVRKVEEQNVKPRPTPQVIDLNNYKILVKGILSPAVLSTVEQNFSKKLKSILVFNHRGSYAMTRCADCGFILKCHRCESSVLFSRTKKQYLCRYCSFSLPSDTVCPSCRKPSWKSFGLGIEQLQKSLQDKLPMARVQAFERDSQGIPKDFDVLIGTWALLRFKHKLKSHLIAFLDIDSELNRLDMRSCFKAWSMVEHLRTMATEQLLIQSRQMDHYCIRSLSQDNREIFYQEDMKVRRELGFSPFSHQVFVHLRGVNSGVVEKAAQELYQQLTKQESSRVEIHAPIPETVAHKRGQYRLNILLQGKDVIGMITLVKQSLRILKRMPKVIITLNVDP